MEEAPAGTDTIWPLQDEGDLTANAMSYVDDYIQAIEFEQCFDSTLLGSDAPYPDLYGATVDWEPVLQRRYAPATRTQQFTSLPCFYTTPTAAVDDCYLSNANTAPEPHQTPSSSRANLWTGENVYFANDNLSTTAITPFTWDTTSEQCSPPLDNLAALPQLASKDFFDPATDEKEIWVSPKDLILCGRREPELMQARQKHEKDVLRRFSRAEDEIASLSRRTYHGTVNNKKRKGGGKIKQAAMNCQKLRSP